MRNRIKAWWRSCSRTLGLMTENSWPSCVRARAEQGNINHPAYGTWTADFMWRQNKSRAFVGKYLNDPCVPWRRKRREIMAIAGTIPVAKWLAKIKQQSDVCCRLCKNFERTRTTQCEHWKFARRDVWAHQQYFLRWNGNNRHGCPQLHLETFVCQHISCTNTNE